MDLPTAPALPRSRWDVLFDNPILRYEGVPRFLRRRKAGGWRVAIMVGLVASTGCGLLLVLSGAEFAAGLGLTLATLWSLVTILAPALQTSRAIARERQRGSWDGIRMSRLRPADIVFGKLLSALLPFWIVGLLLAPLLVMVTAPWGLAFLEVPGHLLERYLTTMGISASFAAVGLFLSLRSREESSTQFQMLMAMAGSYLLSWIAGLVLAALVVDGAPSPELAERLHVAMLCLPGAVAVREMLTRFDRLERISRG